MSLPRYPEYKDSGVEWLGEVPGHWEVKRLGYYFTERREKVSDKDFEPLSVTKNGILPQLETAAKTDDGDNRKKVCTGDFVINSRSDRKGSSGMSLLDGSVSLINTVIQPQKEMGIEFAHHLLRSIPFQEEYYRYGKGIVADLWSTNYSEMKNINLSVPPVTEQQTIAAFLDRETGKIDSLIAEQQRLVELLAEKRQAVISHAVTKGLSPSAPMKDSGIEWLGEVPAHWEVKRLKFLCDVQTGDKDAVNAVDDGDYPFFVRSQTVEKINSFTFDCEAVLTAGDGVGVGKVYHYVNGKFDFHQRVYMMNNFRCVTGKFFFRYLAATFHKVALGGGAKSTVDSLRMPLFMNFEITVPPVDEQSKIIAFVDNETTKFDTLTAEANRAIALLQERRSALISAAVTGKVDVR